MKNPLCLFVSLFLTCVGHLCAQTSLTFSLGGPAGLETISNSMTFANGGVTAAATAWSVSRTAATPVFAQSQVVQWSPGLGVKNSSEVITDVPYVPYYVDNEDHYDFILFVFSEKVNITSVKVHPSAGTFDLDASWWMGNIDSATSLTGYSFSNLSALGFGSRSNSDSVASNSPRDVAITTPVTGVNAILFGARLYGDAEFDRFKISNIQGTTVVPEPSAFALTFASLALVLRRRRR